MVCLVWEEFFFFMLNDWWVEIEDDGSVFFSYYLGVFGDIGMLVYFGLIDIGRFEFGEIVFIFVVGGVVGLVVG